VISRDDLKVGEFEQARRDMWYNSHLHIRIGALGATSVSVPLTKNRTEKVKCARPLHRQIDFGGAGERRRIVVTRQRGLVRNIEDMIHLLDLDGLSLQRRRVLVVVQKDAAELHATPVQRIDRLPTRPRGRRTRPPLLLLRRPAAALFVDVLGSESVDWQVERPGGAHAHWAD
jgi:hypothetical protein